MSLNAAPPWLLPSPPKQHPLVFVYDELMTDTDPTVAPTAALFGDPARARMLMSLMGGRERPASELARTAHVTPQTASAHLAKLQQGGLITVQRRGRWRYYRLAGPEVASVIEALQNLCGFSEPLEGNGAHPNGHVDNALKVCRTCYDHLAGYVAVSLTDALIGHSYLELEEKKTYHITAPGAAALAQLGIDAKILRGKRRTLAKPCLDWTERRPHVGGALGSALLQALLSRSWVVKLEQTRALHLTPNGLAGLQSVFGVRL